MMLCAPRLSKARAVFSLVSPAPMTITCRSCSDSKIFSASSTATEPTDELPQRLKRAVVGSRGHCVDFDAIAGGKNHGFVGRATAPQFLQGFRDPRLGEGKSLSHLDGRRVMAQADDYNCHDLTMNR